MSAEQMVLPGIGESLDMKVAKAIETLKLWESEALANHEDGYYGCFSGGKDSVVIKSLAEKAGVAITWNYSVTTVDPPELVRFIKREHTDVIWHRPEKTLWTMIEKKGLPTRRVRWCCAHLKETGGKNRWKVSGIRAAESKRRADTWKILTRFSSGTNKGFMLNPIFFWTDSDVWNYISKEELSYCSLYDEGFNRLGCVGCPMDSRKAETLERYPRYEKLWRRAAIRYWNLHCEISDAKTYKLFKNGNHWFDWWKSNRSMPDNDGCPGLGLY